MIKEYSNIDFLNRISFRLEHPNIVFDVKKLSFRQRQSKLIGEYNFLKNNCFRSSQELNRLESIAFSKSLLRWL